MSEEQQQVNPILLKFLDAETAEAKYQILRDLQPEEITDRLVDNMAASLDLVIDGGDTDDRFFKLKNAVATMSKYHTERFRR